jgi:hypothetical protein
VTCFVDNSKDDKSIFFVFKLRKYISKSRTINEKYMLQKQGIYLIR